MTQTQTVLNDRYALREQIGSGGMAAVYTADDLRLGRTVAVKVLTPEESRRAGAVERFRREAQAAASLSHPNVVAVYDWGAVDGTAFLVMEHVDGPDLRRVLRERGFFPESEALRLGAEIAAALAVAHRAGIVHRDVKPRNVLLDRDGRAKLADFGIASSSGGSLADGDGGLLADREGGLLADREGGLMEDGDGGDVVYGTALYISPEQARGHAVDARSDLYSLGVLLYELLTGEPPFRGATAAEVADQHISAVPVPPRRLRPSISHRTEQIVLRALSKEPRQRFGSAAEMEQALRDGSRHKNDGSRDASSVKLIGGEASSLGPEASSRRLEPSSRGREASSRGLKASSRGGDRRGLALAMAMAGLVAVSVLVLAGSRLGSSGGPGGLGGLSGLGGLGGGGIGNPFSHLGTATAPSFAGQSLESAQQSAAKLGLTLDVEQQATTETPAGIVVTQSQQGSTVHVVVSSGITVPDLSDKQCTQAKAEAAQTGWSVRPVRWRIANIGDFGKIVAQDPAPGAVVPKAGEITVQVAGPVRPC